MKANKLVLIFVLLLPVIALSQSRAREILHGRVIADSLQVENITVLNVSTKIGAVTDTRGNFNIYAKPADTLFFSSITFHSVKLVLKEADFLEEKLVVKLDMDVTMLDEVKIIALSGDLSKDSRKAKTQLITSGFNSGAIATGYERKYKYAEEKNPLMGPVERDMQGLNFVGIFNALFPGKKRDRAKEAADMRRESFAEGVKNRYTYHFFTQTLKIPAEEIGLFLTFCDSSPKVAGLMDPKREFELTDYLVTKSVEYLKKEK